MVQFFSTGFPCPIKKTKVKKDMENLWKKTGPPPSHRVTEPSPISPSAVAARLRERQKWEFKAQCLSVAAWLGGPRLSQNLDSRNVTLFQVVYVCFFSTCV